MKETWSGQDTEPGNAYAVLYSLQRDTGRWWDFRTYTDREALVAHRQVAVAAAGCSAVAVAVGNVVAADVTAVANFLDSMIHVMSLLDSK